jgi:DNA repair protein RadD
MWLMGYRLGFVSANVYQARNYHNLMDDLFEPEIRARRSAKSEQIEVACPECYTKNVFAARENIDDLQIDEFGYFLNSEGQRILLDAEKNIYFPAHMGRACQGQLRSKDKPGTFVRCSYKWSFKSCPYCGYENDVTARYCKGCKEELIDPNEKLKREFIRVKKDPYALSTDKVLEFSAVKHIALSGKETIRAEIRTEYRWVTAYYMPSVRGGKMLHSWRSLCMAIFGKMLSIDDFLGGYESAQPLQTITYSKNKETGFFEVIDHNRQEDLLYNA